MTEPADSAGSSPAHFAGTAAVILAAGLGTRMRSGRAKVLHRLGGLPLIAWSLRAVRPVAARVVVVVGHEREEVGRAVHAEMPDARLAVQERQLGTGDALRCAAEALGDASTILVLAGDVPGLTTGSLRRLLEAHAAGGDAATLLAFRPEDPTGYGRIVTDAPGTDASGTDVPATDAPATDATSGSGIPAIRAIVEHREADEEQRRIRDCNAGLYAFSAAEVLPRLDALRLRGSGESYLTDVVEMLASDGYRVSGQLVDEHEVAGINTQAQLAAADARYRRARAAELMDAGVTLLAPDTVIVDADAQAGPGSVLGPHACLLGRSIVGSRCEIGPFVVLDDVRVGDGAIVRGPLRLASTAVPEGAIVGPGEAPPIGRSPRQG